MRKLAIAVLMTVPLFAGGVFAQQTTGKDTAYEELNLFDEAFERIRQDAVDPVTDAKLVGAAIAGMLSGLDPHSAYLDQAQFKASQAPANDDATTLGLVVTIDNGQLKVISPQDGSPAARAGITPGDVIFAIDKEPVYDLTLGEAEQKLRGPAGSEVQLTLRRDAEKPIDLTLKREAYKVPTVAGRVEGGNIGYLRIAGFDAGTQAALADAVQDLRQKAGNKLIGFILDLRNNPGRFLRGRGRRRRCLHRQGRHRRRQGPQARQCQADQRSPHAGRSREGSAARCAGQRRHGAGGRTRRRRAAGQPPGGAARHQDLRRELDRKPDPVG